MRYAWRALWIYIYMDIGKSVIIGDYFANICSESGVNDVIKLERLNVLERPLVGSSVGGIFLTCNYNESWPRNARAGPIFGRYFTHSHISNEFKAHQHATKSIKFIWSVWMIHTNTHTRADGDGDLEHECTQRAKCVVDFARYAKRIHCNENGKWRTACIQNYLKMKWIEIKCEIFCDNYDADHLITLSGVCFFFPLGLSLSLSRTRSLSFALALKLTLAHL